MAPEAQPLPMRFPCWCRATYSWGGETKRDLGFIEGDLIECLNAGDGSWWMGRLRRDRRMVGLFPSNFVQVLDESFQIGGSRNASPLPLQNGGSISRVNSANTTPIKATPQKTKSMFRKPFTAYAAAGSPNPGAAAREVQQKAGLSPNSGSISKHKPYSSMKRGSPDSREPSPLSRPAGGSQLRAVSPAPPSVRRPIARAMSPAPPRPHQSYARAASPIPPTQYKHHSRAPSPIPPTQFEHHSRAPSPIPPTQFDHSRVPSPAPSAQYRPYSRGPSPAPPTQYQSYSRAASPAPPAQYESYSRAASPAPSFDFPPRSRGPSPHPYDAHEQSPPPPPPPPHRVAFNHSRAPSLAPHNEQTPMNGYHTPAPRSPAPPSPTRGGFTPSPLTNAMNDVMTSLQDMTMSRSDNSPDEPITPPNVWSPEAFDQVYHASAKKLRPRTSLGIGALGDYSNEDELQGQPQFHPDFDDDRPPQVQNYVQRMESRLRKMQQQENSPHVPRPRDELFIPQDQTGPPPAVPPKSSAYQPRPQSSIDQVQDIGERKMSLRRTLRHRKSAYEVGREVLGRTFTTKTNSTSTTHSSNTTHHSLMSGHSATNMSATSAGSYYRKKFGMNGGVRARPFSVMDTRDTNSRVIGIDDGRPETPFTGVTYHSSHASQSRPGTSSGDDWAGNIAEGSDPLGGLMAPKAKKSGFFRKVIDTAKTSAASARSTIASGQSSRPISRQSKILPNGVTAISGGATTPSSAARDMGLGGGVDWVQVRRDVNRSNSLSKNERNERAERCQMLDIPVINPIEALYESAEGDEGLDGLPITEPMDFSTCNLALVDKSSRFINSVPLGATSASLAQGYVCRPYRSDVQRLRAIFTWVSERISWEEDFEGDIDTQHIIQTKRGCSQEIAILVFEMCSSVGLHAEVVRGYLKTPGEALDLDLVARPNHYWNAVIVDGEWRIMDCSLAGPTNPKRSQYSSTGSQVAEGWWFLTRPIEICYTHVPLLPEQQHICPPVSHEILMALPCACPPYFKYGLQMVDFDTSLLNLDNLELAHIHFNVPEDVECLAEVEARGFAQDADGDYFESGDMVKKPALAQAEWIGEQKQYTVKALLPGDEGHGVLKVYAGKRGLMHSIKSNPHALAFALPLTHTGQNPPYSFFTLHPTPHAQRHDLYIAQPQCSRLALNNTFVFAIRQHQSSLNRSPDPSMASDRPRSPNPFARPTSAMSMISMSQTGSSYSNPSSTSSNSSSSAQKPAKLAIQTPGGKIIRLLRKSEHMGGTAEGASGSIWETVIKIGERGTWRGLVLADRSARWCVFGEWECE